MSPVSVSASNFKLITPMLITLLDELHKRLTRLEAEHHLTPQQAFKGEKKQIAKRRRRKCCKGTMNNCCSCNQATKSEFFLMFVTSLDFSWSAIQRFFSLYNYSQWQENVTSHWNWLIPNRCRQVQGNGKLKVLFAWACEVKWNHKSSAPKRPSLFALTPYLVPTERDEHACLCKDCVACWLTVFTLYCVNVHVVSKVTFACSMLVSFHLKKSHGRGLQPYQQDNATCTCSRHIGANAGDVGSSLACIILIFFFFFSN